MTMEARDHAAFTAEVEAPDLTAIPQPNNRMVAILIRFRTDLRALDRKYPVVSSPIARARMRRFFSDWREAIEKQLDFDALNHEEKVDYLLFKNHLDYCLRRRRLQEAQDAEIEPLLPFGKAILALEEARFAMDWTTGEAAASALNSILAAIRNAHSALENTKEEGSTLNWKRAVANRAVRMLSTLREALKHWYGFYHGFDPMFTWWVESPYNAVEAALGSYANLVQTRLVGGVTEADGESADIIGDPIGRDALVDELKFEMIPYTPEELIEIANLELSWCEEQLQAAAGELGFGTDTAAVLEHVKGLHAPPGGQAALVKDLAYEAIAYLEEHDLVTVPPLARELWRLEMMSPEKQKVNPFFLGGEVIQVSFPTNTMTHEEKQMSMRGNNAHFSRATVQHELIPGHHLQFYMVDRYRTHRSPFHTPFWVEGWTIYWELLLYKRGFPRGPEDRVGMLFWRIHRCVRIIFSLSFHMELMSPAECIEMLVNRVGHERANAIAEVRRSCGDAYPPLYQCAYMIGGLQVWALRQELVETGVMPEKEFHDALVRESCIPIEMVRADLTGQTLTRDFVSNWRFYKGLAGA